MITRGNRGISLYHTREGKVKALLKLRKILVKASECRVTKDNKKEAFTRRVGKNRKPELVLIGLG